MVGEVDSTLKNRHITPIGIIHSCFTEKFGIPRQPGMVASATAQLELLPPFNRREMVRGLEQFSHIWVHFQFHETLAEGWKPTVRPPWLGGQKESAFLLRAVRTVPIIWAYRWCGSRLLSGTRGSCSWNSPGSIFSINPLFSISNHISGTAIASRLHPAVMHSANSRRWMLLSVPVPDFLLQLFERNRQEYTASGRGSDPSRSATGKPEKKPQRFWYAALECQHSLDSRGDQLLYKKLCGNLINSKKVPMIPWDGWIDKREIRKARDTRANAYPEGDSALYNSIMI